ncbi:hypothetical protein [Allorhizocola rhizosphaerae]|uniref:hypothetical protein n=1 Tax=Allorhizocola rhizosphaerae TaxID=1872709 RepID=UPI0013C30C8E|nr:hypothetical protein [Allorhizocola rhizosphaerae]
MRRPSTVVAQVGLALAAAAAIALPASPVSAAEGRSDRDAGKQRFTSVTFDGVRKPATPNTVGEEYATTRANPQRGADKKQAFIDSEAAAGRFHDRNSIDYLRFEHPNGEAVEALVPRNYRIDSVVVGAGLKRGPDGKDEMTVSASATGGEVETSDHLAYPAGPGFETFSYVNDGTYWLTSQYGALEFHWIKYKDKLETNNTKDAWAYTRWAEGTHGSAGWPRYWYVMDMGMRSYPTSSSRNILLGWLGYSPDIGEHQANCNDNWTVAVYNLAYNFKACETYRVDRNSYYQDAGDMSVNWKNNQFSWVYASGGPQKMAAIFAVTSRQGYQPYYKDYIYINWMNDSMNRIGGCGATDGSANC